MDPFLDWYYGGEKKHNASFLISFISPALLVHVVIYGFLWLLTMALPMSTENLG